MREGRSAGIWEANLVLLLPRSPKIQGTIKSKLAIREYHPKDQKRNFRSNTTKNRWSWKEKIPLRFCEVGCMVMGWRLRL